MTARWVFVLAALAAGLMVSATHAQQVLFTDPNLPAGVRGAEDLVVLPLDGDGSTDLLMRSNELPGPANQIEQLPIFRKQLSMDLGFQFIQPHFNSRTTRLVIPAGAAGNFPVLASADNLGNDFALSPTFSLNYPFTNLGFGLSISGKQLQISGKLHKTSGSAAGNGDLTVNGSVNLTVVNFLEASKNFTEANCPCLRHTCFEDCEFVATVGARYAKVNQVFGATLQGNNSNQAKVNATEDFTGFGVTASLGALCPIYRQLFGYWFSRGSLLLGDNARTSSSTLAVADVAIPSSGVNLTETRTILAPCGEIEIGLAYNTEVGPTTRDGQRPSVLWFKVGAVASIWGDLGLLSITEGPQTFSDGSLLLYGFNVMVGFQH